MKNRRFIYFLLLSELLLASCNIFKIESVPQVQKGVLVIDNQYLEKKGTIILDGEWEFYWSKFINSSSNFIVSNNQISWIKVPGIWNKRKSFPKNGYASYRMTLILNSTNHQLFGIKIMNISTSYQVYFNGDLLR